MGVPGGLLRGRMMRARWAIVEMWPPLRRSGQGDATCRGWWEEERQVQGGGWHSGSLPCITSLVNQSGGPWRDVMRPHLMESSN